MTPKGHAIPSKTQLLSYGTPAFAMGCFFILLPDCFHEILSSFTDSCYTYHIIQYEEGFL